MFLFALEFPELSQNIAWLNVYLRSKSASFFLQLKKMYTEFLDICEANLWEASVLDALYLYSKIDYPNLLHKELGREAKKKHHHVNIIEPVGAYVVDKYPEFKDERKVFNTNEISSKINSKEIDVKRITPLSNKNIPVNKEIKIRRYHSPKYNKYTSI